MTPWGLKEFLTWQGEAVLCYSEYGNPPKAVGTGKTILLEVYYEESVNF